MTVTEDWKMHKPILFSALLAAVALLAGSPAQAQDAPKLFKFYCAQCHGLEGKGDGPNVSKTYPVDPRNFTNSAEMEKLSDADLKNVIIDGGPSASKSPMMPPWGKTLTETEVDALVKYVRELCQCQGKAG